MPPAMPAAIMFWMAVGGRHDVLEHVQVKRHVEGARAHRSHLTEQDVLSDASAVVDIAHGRGLQENFDRLLERASRERSCVGTVDAVPRDGHECALVAHEVDQQRDACSSRMNRPFSMTPLSSLRAHFGRLRYPRLPDS